jgi:hypothetical protein
MAYTFSLFLLTPIKTLFNLKCDEDASKSRQQHHLNDLVQCSCKVR